MAWRYIAQRLTGDGAGEFLTMDLPLKGVAVTKTLSGPDQITGTIAPEIGLLRDDSGRLLLEEWSTALYAEQDGKIRGGAILTGSSFDGPSWRVDSIGFAGYPQGMPYTSATFFVEADPADIYRHIWEHLQSQPDGNLGVVVDPTTTAKRIGTELRQAEFDTQSGPLSFESGPYKLAWYLTDDCGSAMDALAEQTPFEYRERHTWVDGSYDEIEHRIELGYPSLGTRRHDVRFVIGENVSAAPAVEVDGEDYANQILALGAGEGRDMIRGDAGRPDGRLRRVAVVTDKQRRTKREARSLAVKALAERQASLRGAFATVTVRDHPHARIGSWTEGDEIRVQGKLGWVDVDDWYRVTSTTLQPDAPDIATISIVRSDAVMA